MTQSHAALNRIASGPFLANAAPVRSSAKTFGILTTWPLRAESAASDPQSAYDLAGSSAYSLTRRGMAGSDHMLEPTVSPDMRSARRPSPARSIGLAESTDQPSSSLARAKQVASADGAKIQADSLVSAIDDTGETGGAPSARARRVRRTEKAAGTDSRPEATRIAEEEAELPQTKQLRDVHPNHVIETAQPLTRKDGDLRHSEHEGRSRMVPESPSAVTAASDEAQRVRNTSLTESRTNRARASLRPAIPDLAVENASSTLAPKCNRRTHLSRLDTGVAPSVENGAPGPLGNAPEVTARFSRDRFALNWSAGIERRAPNASAETPANQSRDPVAVPVSESAPRKVARGSTVDVEARPIVRNPGTVLETSSMLTLSRFARIAPSKDLRSSNRPRATAVTQDTTRRKGNDWLSRGDNVAVPVQAQLPLTVNTMRGERNGSNIEGANSDVATKPQLSRAPVSHERAQRPVKRPVLAVGSTDVAPVAPAPLSRTWMREPAPAVRQRLPVHASVLVPTVAQGRGTDRTTVLPVKQGASVVRPAPFGATMAPERALSPVVPKRPASGVQHNVARGSRVSISIGQIEIRAVATKVPHQRHAAIAARAHSFPSNLWSLV